MSGLSFSLPGLEQTADPQQLRGCLLRLTEQLQYVLSNLGGENFSKETQERLEHMERSARAAEDLAEKNEESAKTKFRQLYEELVRTADELSNEFIVSLQEKADSIFSQVTEDFTAKSETADLEETFRSEMEETSQKIETRFLDAAQISQEVEGKLGEYRNLVDTYIQFNAEGIILGERDSPFTAVLGRERISFRQNGAEVAYLSNNKLFITNAEVLNCFTIGSTGSGFFDWVPGTNGNLGMKWRQK